MTRQKRVKALTTIVSQSRELARVLPVLEKSIQFGLEKGKLVIATDPYFIEGLRAFADALEDYADPDFELHDLANWRD
jgi:hypothetical protein